MERQYPKTEGWMNAMREELEEIIKNESGDNEREKQDKAVKTLFDKEDRAWEEWMAKIQQKGEKMKYLRSLDNDVQNLGDSISRGEDYIIAKMAEPILTSKQNLVLAMKRASSMELYIHNQRRLASGERI